MRSYFVLGLLIALLIGWGVHIALRPLPSRVIVSSQPPDRQAASTPRVQVVRSDLDGTKAGGGRPSAKTKARTAGDEAQTNVPPALIERPLKVVGLGWPTLAAGVWANGGLAPSEESRFSTESELEVNLRVVESPIEVVRALAEGGGDSEGADVAIVPLQTLVASYEDLEPLHPEIFLVTGWSNGHHLVMARRGPDDTIAISDSGEMTPTEDMTIETVRGSPEHFLALFFLDLAGIDVSQTQLIDHSSEEAPPAALVALEVPPRGVSAEPGLDVLTSTTVASRAIPIVAVASRRFIEDHGEALESFALIWLRASEEMMSQVPEAARQLGAIEGAPEALDLLGPLVRHEPVGVEDNARIAGLAGQGMVTLERLFAVSFELFARVGVVGPIELECAPISTETIAAVARAGLVQQSRQAVIDRPVWRDQQVAVELGDGELQAMVFIPTAALGIDDEALVERLGLVAGVFESSFFRARRRGLDGAQLEDVLATAVDRYSIAPERVVEAENGLNAGVVVLRQR